MNAVITILALLVALAVLAVYFRAVDRADKAIKSCTQNEAFFKKQAKRFDKWRHRWSESYAKLLFENDVVKRDIEQTRKANVEAWNRVHEMNSFESLVAQYLNLSWEFDKPSGAWTRQKSRDHEDLRRILTERLVAKGFDFKFAPKKMKPKLMTVTGQGKAMLAPGDQIRIHPANDAFTTGGNSGQLQSLRPPSNAG